MSDALPDSLHLDPANASLWRGLQQLKLRPKDFAVLLRLTV
jgi:hypothetical protein